MKEKYETETFYVPLTSTPSTSALSINKYDEAIQYLSKSQKYIGKLMDDEIPNKIYTVDQVKEVDEETENYLKNSPKQSINDKSDK